MKSNKGLLLPIIAAGFGVFAAVPYLDILVSAFLRFNGPVLPIGLSLAPFCLGINGLLSGVISVAIAGSALFQSTHRPKAVVLLAAIAIALGLFGIAANLWVYHFVATGDY